MGKKKRKGKKGTEEEEGEKRKRRKGKIGVCLQSAHRARVSLSLLTLPWFSVRKKAFNPFLAIHS